MRYNLAGMAYHGSVGHYSDLELTKPLTILCSSLPAMRSAMRVKSRYPTEYLDSKILEKLFQIGLIPMLGASALSALDVGRAAWKNCLITLEVTGCFLNKTSSTHDARVYFTLAWFSGLRWGFGNRVVMYSMKASLNSHILSATLMYLLRALTTICSSKNDVGNRVELKTSTAAVGLSRRVCSWNKGHHAIGGHMAYARFVF